MTFSKVFAVFLVTFACLSALALALLDNENDESQNRKESELSENEDPIFGDVIPQDRQYTLKVTMENYENEPVKVLQEMAIPSEVEVKSYTLTTTDVNTTKETGIKSREQCTQTSGGIVNILAGERIIAELNYVNHPSLMFDPSTKTFHKMAASIEVLSNGLVGGEISTSNYPNNYPNGADFTWVISYPPGNNIRLEILYFSMENCCDHLTIYDGSNMSFPTLSTFDGDFDPGESNVVLSSQPAMFLRFTSDCLVSRSGFLASYLNQQDQSPPVTAYYNPNQCSDIEFLSGVYVTSPGYNLPGWYPPGQSCQWRIQVPAGDIVRLYVHYFYTEYYTDWINIYDGYNTFYRIGSMSGYVDSGTTVAIANSNQATVTFYSNCCSDYPGFILYIASSYEPPTSETSANAMCSSPEYHAGYSGYISSPDYPNYYSANLDCSYFIQTPYGTSVGLYIQSFSVGPGDYLKIYNAHTEDFIRQMTGDYLYNYHIDTYTDYIQLVFTTASESYDPSSGFYIRYDAEYYTTAPPDRYNCGTDVPYNIGTITSPGYPTSYSGDLDCLWTVQVDSNMYVLFTINSFSTEYCCDYVDIYKGSPGNSQGLVDTCRGDVSPGTEILVRDNDAYLVFHADGSLTNGGFSISYSPVSYDYVNSFDSSYIVPHKNSNKNHQHDIGRVGNPTTLGRDLWDGAKNRPPRRQNEEEGKP